MISDAQPGYTVRGAPSHWIIAFAVMASPCEILVRCKDRSEALHLASLSLLEARRIESKLSRYRDDNVVHAINHSHGAKVETDPELARLLNHAEQCYRLSEGRFDITSGVLRKAWTFDGSTVTPDPLLIDSLRKQIGWDRVNWDGSALRMQPGMEIDLGGIGKEYAVDVVAELLFRDSGASIMVNFGGDIRAIASPGDSTPWIVGIEDPEREGHAVGQIDLAHGGVATSGDARRFCVVEGERLGHILDPLTGWPVAGAPESVTVLGESCVEAGFMATLAMLHGPDAEEFLRSQGVPYHCIR